MQREGYFMMEYIILVYLSLEDSKGLSEGKCKKAMTNALKVTQIFFAWRKTKQNKMKSVQKFEEVTKSLQFLQICRKMLQALERQKEKANTQIILTEK